MPAGPTNDSDRNQLAGAAASRVSVNLVAIVLTVASIIQGLAVSSLASSMGSVRGVLHWSLFLLAFLVVVRLFQTYVLAALDYPDWSVQFFDIILIFGLGLVQYRMIDTLSAEPFLPAQLERWFFGLAVAAVIGYSGAFVRFQHADPRYVARERQLQAWNIAGSCTCLLLAAPFLFTWPLDEKLSLSLVLTQSLILSANIWYSIHRTLPSSGPDSESQAREATASKPGVSRRDRATDLSLMLILAVMVGWEAYRRRRGK